MTSPRRSIAGGEMNAFTAKEYTSYYCRLPAEHVALGIELLGDVLTAPALRDAEVESERQVILEELLMDEDTHEDRVHTLLFASLFPKHPLGRETAGDRKSVAAVRGDDIRSFFSHWYRPSNMVVAAAGHVDHDDIVAEVKRRFAADATIAAPQRHAPRGKVRPLAVLRRGTEQAHIAIGFRGLPRTDPDREALDAVNHVLGGGMSSRLFDEIREQRGLAYAVYSSPVSYADAGALTVYAGTAPSNVDDVLDLVDGELKRMLAEGLDEDDLAVALGYLTGSYVIGLEDTASRMSRLGAQLTVLGRVLGRGTDRPLPSRHPERRGSPSNGCLAAAVPRRGRTAVSQRAGDTARVKSSTRFEPVPEPRLSDKDENERTR
jgi:predicted Zn-dependent peptidase